MQTKELILIVEQIAAILIKNNKQLTVAESCTGGWAAKVLTDLAGSSVWFERGFVTYSNQAKHEMLSVPKSILEKYGAVSQQTVNEMATGALINSHADFSLSISGIAGPGGGSADKPVGLVWFAWGNSQGIVGSEQRIFSGDREAIREQAVVHALTRLVKIIDV